MAPPRYIIRPFSRSEPTWQRESLWMKDAVEANVLLCFIGCSESFWMCNLKISPPKAFLFLATHKDCQQDQCDCTGSERCTFVRNSECTCGTRRASVQALSVNLYVHACKAWRVAARWGSEGSVRPTAARPSLSCDNLQSSTIIQSHPNTKGRGCSTHLFSKKFKSIPEAQEILAFTGLISQFWCPLWDSCTAGGQNGEKDCADG